MKKIIAILACVCLVLTAAVVPAFAANDEIVLTVTSLGLASNSYSAGTATVDGVDFEYVQLGNYGDGIQVRDSSKGTSYFWNTVAFSKPIKEIKLVYSSTKDVQYANPDCEIYSFGNAADNYTYSTKLSTTAGVKEYTITPDAETYTFLKFEHDLGYSMYWDSITIVLADNTPAPSSSQAAPSSSEEASSSEVASTSSEVASTSSEVASTSSEATTSTTTGTTSPTTGYSVALFAVMALVAAAAVVVVAKKARA